MKQRIGLQVAAPALAVGFALLVSGLILLATGYSPADVLKVIVDDGFQRERLFKPFESTKPAGMGIGVFESREYIHELGGALALTSVPAQGSTFTVTLPLYREAGAERAA